MRYAKWITVIMLLVPSIAAAQIGTSARVVADVPFTYIVANTVVPLGPTTIQAADPAGRFLVVRNRSAKIDIFATVSTGSDKKAASYALVFHKYGRRYFLAGLKVDGSAAFYRFTPSKFEQELVAQNEPATEEILLASLK